MAGSRFGQGRGRKSSRILLGASSLQSLKLKITSLSNEAIIHRAANFADAKRIRQGFDADAVRGTKAHKCITHGTSETRAFGVSSVMAQFSLGGGTGESAMSSAGGTTTWKFDLPPEKSITVGEKAVWKSSWQKLDVEKIRANRSAAIADGLKKDARYASKLNTPIE